MCPTPHYADKKECQTHDADKKDCPRHDADARHRQAVDLSDDQKPDREDEKVRILKCGGRVQPLTVSIVCWTPSLVSIVCWTLFLISIVCWTLLLVSIMCWTLLPVSIMCWTLLLVSIMCQAAVSDTPILKCGGRVQPFTVCQFHPEEYS